MTFRRTLPVILFLFVLGGAWSLREANASRAEIGPAAHAIDGLFARKIGHGTVSAPDVGAQVTQTMDGRNERVSAKRVATIGAGAAALLAEEIELRALGGDVALSLTEREWMALAGVTLNTQAVRHAYEAEIAVATLREDGRQRLEIPAYVEAGAALRREFYAELLKELGESAAMEVVRKLSDRLEARFAGFGAGVQTLDFSTGSGRGEGALRAGSVTRTVVFWNESNATEATRTRSETIFPQIEDPDGLQWGPLLARVEAAQAQGKKSRG
jgi:hypothetical protein